MYIYVIHIFWLLVKVVHFIWIYIHGHILGCYMSKLKLPSVHYYSYHVSESMSVTESDLIHQRVWGGQSVDSSVAPPAVFILNELWPLLIRRLWTQLLRCRHCWSPHLIGQLVTEGNKQLGEEGIKGHIRSLKVVWVVQSQPYLYEWFSPDLVVQLQTAYLRQVAAQSSMLTWEQTLLAFCIETNSSAGSISIPHLDYILYIWEVFQPS